MDIHHINSLQYFLFSHFSGRFIVFPSFTANTALLKGTQSVVIVIEEGTVHSSLPDQRTIMCVNKTSQLVWFPALFTAGDPPAEDWIPQTSEEILVGCRSNGVSQPTGSAMYTKHTVLVLSTLRCRQLKTAFTCYFPGCFSTPLHSHSRLTTGQPQDKGVSSKNICKRKMFSTQQLSIKPGFWTRADLATAVQCVLYR